MNWLDKLICAAVLILLAVLLGGKPKAAEPVWETFVFPSGEGSMSLSDQPCSVPNVMQEWENVRSQAKARLNLDVEMPKQSRLLWHGQVYAGCYVVSQDFVYNIDSTLERFVPLPHTLFGPHEKASPPGSKEV